MWRYGRLVCISVDSCLWQKPGIERRATRIAGYPLLFGELKRMHMIDCLGSWWIGQPGTF
ncbi:unnamed protein product [Ectocarpus sp. 6 AP-2014]